MNTSKDECWKVICYFFNITNIFNQHQHCMKSGDSILMEKIENEFCGVFLLLKKTNYVYVEIVLYQTEKSTMIFHTMICMILDQTVHTSIRMILIMISSFHQCTY